MTIQPSYFCWLRYSLVHPGYLYGSYTSYLRRFYVAKLSHLGTHAGRLYGLNTVGAALGALLCGFWLIDLLGIGGALIFAVLANGIIGISCLLVGYKAETRRVTGKRAMSGYTMLYGKSQLKNAYLIGCMKYAG